MLSVAHLERDSVYSRLGMAKVAYQNQTFNTPNPIARYAHRARLRRALDYADRLLPASGCLLDFGCGTGDFLNAFAQRRGDADLVGFEPFMPAQPGGSLRVGNMADIQSASIDLLCCFEVLEHLSDADFAIFIEQGRRVLKPGGRALVSVPIIGGLTLLLKEGNRAIMFRRRSDYTALELLRASFLGVPAPRPAVRLLTHKGFDFKATENALKSTYGLSERELCPFPWLPWWLNSQAFFVLEHRRS